MEFLYDIGLFRVFKEDGMAFISISNLIPKSHAEVIGCYVDKKDILRRIKRDSPHGKKILEYYDIKDNYNPSDAEVRLKELMVGLADRMDLNKVNRK